MKPMRIAILGCGSRGRTYARIAAEMPERYQLVAVADRDEAKTATLAELGKPGEIQVFDSDKSLFAAGKLADVLMICTQDADHYGNAMDAMDLGYDMVLEKPAAETLERCEELDRKARETGCRILPCFVLRYTPFYQAVRKFIDSGKLGRIMSIRATEGVEAFHQAHSYVRGHWAKAEDSSPMIVAKCSHDTDLMCWFADSKPKSITSHGRLDWFKEENAPEGAPERCTDGCPVASECIYDAHRYLNEKRNFLRMVMPGAEGETGAYELPEEPIIEFLKTSPWGRCVYRCDNNVVDHQVVACEMENGITASLTMTAFDCDRTIEIFGTNGCLKGGEPFERAGSHELWYYNHYDGKVEEVPVEKASEDDGYASHGGGDFGIVDSIDRLFAGPNALSPGLDGLAGHRLAYRAEDSRLDGGAPKS